MNIFDYPARPPDGRFDTAIGGPDGPAGKGFQSVIMFSPQAFDIVLAYLICGGALFMVAGAIMMIVGFALKAAYT